MSGHNDKSQATQFDASDEPLLDGDARLLAQLAAGETHEEAAQACGCSRSTVTRRLADPAFRARLDAMQAALIDHHLAALVAAGSELVKELVALAKDPDPRVRLQATLGALDRMLKLRENVKFAERLQVLEDRAAAQLKPT